MNCVECKENDIQWSTPICGNCYLLLVRYKKKYLELRRNAMPLVKGKKAKTRKGFGENVKREMHEGKPQKQAVAIAYSEARGKKKKKKK